VPAFRTLDRSECEAILERNVVGRIAFSFHDRVDIEPLHYVYDGAWLFGRTSPGSKLTTLQHSQWVAFEVDEIEGLFDWRSVVVHGAVYVVSAEGSESEAEALRRGIAMLRRLIPETGSADDPVAFRTVVFRLHIDRLTGRMASTATPKG
jgi:nitroimidazol reductase NimA-like FMN-containing flavoprotein (pyridoxamine 5'-phosphate oxidase superfamily)